MHPYNTFATLTYNDEDLPTDDLGRGILLREDAQKFLKLLRFYLQPVKIRYYGCGEYGETSWRPHFHFILFNYPPCYWGQTRPGRESCCFACDTVRKAWKKGHVMLGSVTDQSARYVAGYVTKKMTQVDDERLQGRPPEFPMMSKNPGIGHDFMWDVASQLMMPTRHGPLVDSLDDVPGTLRHGGKEMPLGRYLRGKLRKMVGQDEKAPQATLDKVQDELQPVRARARSNPGGLKAQILEENEQHFENLQAREKIRVKRKTKL